SDPVLLAQVARRERRRGTERLVERALGLRGRLGERVDEQDHVGVPLRMVLVHPELAATGARTPVHAPHAVAGNEGPEIGELDPFAALARDVVAAEDVRLRGLQEPAQLLLARVRLQRTAALVHLLPPDEAAMVVGAKMNAAERVPAPTLAFDSVAQPTLLAGAEPERDRVLAVDRLQTSRHFEQQPDLRNGLDCAQRHRGLDLFALERPV